MTTQRQQTHASGSFPDCPQCGREPRHIHDARRRPLGGHLLSCACGDSSKFDTLAGAVRAWCAARNVSMTVRAVRDIATARSVGARS